MKKSRLLGAICACIAFASLNTSAAIVIDNSVSGNTTNDFEGLLAGSVAGLVSQSGATYGELFVGQTLSTAGGFDSLSGTPTTALDLEANAVVADNIGISSSFTNVIYGDLGGAIGEGALSILLDTETNIFGFDVLGSHGGLFNVDLFDSNGSLLGSFSQTAINSFFGFSVNSGPLIAAVSITNTDSGGIAYDNFTFNSAAVPIPAAAWLFGSGLLGLIGLSRRKKSS